MNVQRPKIISNKLEVISNKCNASKARYLALITYYLLPITYYLLLIAAPLRADTSATVDRLRTGLSDLTSIRATYTQEKTLSLFKQTLVIKGRMLLDGKGSLLWVTDEPVRSALTIRDGTLRLWDEDSGRVTSLPVSQIPALPALTGQLQNWLRGNFDALARDYDIRVENESPPTLTASPRKPESAPFSRVTLVFNEDPLHLRRVELTESDGNRTAILFGQVELNTPVKSADWTLPPKQP